MGNTMTAPSGRKLGLEDFDLVRLVGKGAFGKVWQVRRKDTGEVFAMKVLDKKTVVEQNLVEHTVFERDVMLTCNNPFIINLYYAFQTEESLYFVLDFVGGGSLFTVLRDHPYGYFTEEQGRFYAAEILLGIEELHKNGIAYRDLKLENILLGIDGHIILTDFGLSARLPDNAKLHSFSGTAIYLAPEVLLGEGHDLNVDWWSYGVLVHLLLTGEPPFWSENRRELFDMIVFGQIIVDDPLLTNSGRDLILKLLNRNTKKRLGCSSGADEIKKHKFFAGLNWNNVYKRKLKPPHVPDQEFLLTTRTVPLPPPSGQGNSEDDEEDSEVYSPGDYNFFQGFSFATSRAPPASVDPKHVSASFGKLVYNEESGKRSKKKKRGILPPTLDLSNVEGPLKVPEGPPIKLELLKEQASKDNRNRKFITVGDETAQSTASEDAPANAESIQVPLRVTRVLSNGKAESATGDGDKRKKKKHRSTQALSALLSPRRRSAQVGSLHCNKCEVLLDANSSYHCKVCQTIVCKNCVNVNIPTEKAEDILTHKNCINCYYMKCIKNLRKKK